MEQSVELVPLGRCDGQVIRAVGRGPKAVRCPACRHGQSAVLLQSPARHVLPIDRDRSRRITDVKRRCAGRLNDLDERPETARNGIIASRQRPRGVRLANRAA